MLQNCCHANKDKYWIFSIYFYSQLSLLTYDLKTRWSKSVLLDTISNFTQDRDGGSNTMAGIFKFCPKSMGHFCLLNQQVSELNTWNTQMQLKEYVDCCVLYELLMWIFVLFWFDLQNWQNNFRFTTCSKHINQLRIGCQILASLKKLYTYLSCILLVVHIS